MIRALPLVLLLAGCGDNDRRLWSRSEIQDIASDMSGDGLEHETRIGTLEYRINQLEKELDRERLRTRRMDDASIADTDAVNSEIDRLTKNDKIFQDHVNYLRSLHGVQPMN